MFHDVSCFMFHDVSCFMFHDVCMMQSEAAYGDEGEQRPGEAVGADTPGHCVSW